MSDRLFENTPSFWDSVYMYDQYKKADWYEPIPVTSISIISRLALPGHASIIDVGAGTGGLARPLLALGYENITLLDFSKEALHKARRQLKSFASKIRWLHLDLMELEAREYYQLWYDRAVFSFFTNKEHRLLYAKKAYESLKTGGLMIIGAYAKPPPPNQDPLLMEIYSEESLSKFFSPLFRRIYSLTRHHITPDYQLQPFVFSVFQKI
jgi:SAM-dependent methyltransferase